MCRKFTHTKSIECDSVSVRAFHDRAYLIMTKKVKDKTEVRITVNIKPVKLAEVTPVQQQLALRFWARLVAQVRDDVKK